MNRIDTILNKVTMYRVMMYGLSGLAVICIGSAAIGWLSLSPLQMIISLLILLGASFVTNQIMSRVWNVTANLESWAITGLILFFLLPPIHSVERGLFVAAAAVIAIVSKYLIAWRGQHIFNPAAFGVFVTGTIGLVSPTWWIGSSVLWPIVLLYGLAVLRKVRKFQMALVFTVVSLAAVAVSALASGNPFDETMRVALLASPLIFLGTVMLTEPSTMPPRYRQTLLFAALVGLFYGLRPAVFDTYIYPETALLIGNLYAFAVSAKQRYHLRLLRVENLSPNSKNFVFESTPALSFLPGQYTELTLATPKIDMRGNRRFFSIASSPSSKTIEFGIRFYKQPSAFKRQLLLLKPGDSVYASQARGDFLLPGDAAHNIALIAGGIGITPFRGMLDYIDTTHLHSKITLYFVIMAANELLYKDALKAAQSKGITIVVIDATKQDSTKLLPVQTDQLYFISGSPQFVDTTKLYLRENGIADKNIRTDHFSGY